jgi:hypothetical protein
LTRITAHAPPSEPYEGHELVRVTAVATERKYLTFHAGDVWVPLDQRGGALAATLLEAQSPDGFMAWGFFHTVFQKKEYGGDYIVEPMARAMLAHDPKLAADFKAKLAADTAFANNPNSRSIGSTAARRGTTRSGTCTRSRGRCTWCRKLPGAAAGHAARADPPAGDQRRSTIASGACRLSCVLPCFHGREIRRKPCATTMGSPCS